MQIKKDRSALHVFETLESEVRSYCRSFPAVFTKAKGHKLWDRDGREYIDFFSGAGALNYGHNEERMKKKLIDYLANDGITHSLDMATEAKEAFLKKFHDVILKPRTLNYKVMFPGPTGTNSVESALKLARKVTGRENVISFTNSFHGMTIGSLAVTGNTFKRRGAGVPLNYTVTMPYDNYFGADFDTIKYLKRFLEDNGSGLDLPAAIILETVQGEGGLNAARFEWLQKIEQICRKWNILLIVDDVQAGCGRTGTFFSFEQAGIKPDIVCLSKSIGGYGLPLALTLFKPELDVWAPGEHNGTFRGNNLAFIAATEALSFWETPAFEQKIKQKSERVNHFLQSIVSNHPGLQGEVRGRGLMQGIACAGDGLAERICREAFKRGLIMETSGPAGEVVKLFPPLTINDQGLDQGLSILEESIQAALDQ
ncbi:diaminobutyrate/2-oxoglutarate aminotransferase [Caldalkalibacillus thermarum TA2.A1]|uniref:Diaminobutyrate--2-oxoglutarate transaminase n=1 Tax=Caldalkalibacillus thermarum (strain TA2.A1) TaxID=986075 RepID=F5L4B6_CALTT|nr:diaminobutyrate--2-oxoglutarate transaminase [Caldalkalibacillus thermarum]EGL83812.1 diaminobutyrate/2-oxoglutarate aminotransferase [Caldalkalibacillus thermarum TA2.A1]QZT32858.1 diaminobutyrate--2-oxoglutarate transaminase [Caldalkalibacillus thermarum TA2.A1]